MSQPYSIMKFLLILCILSIPHALLCQNSTGQCTNGNSTAETTNTDSGQTANFLKPVETAKSSTNVGNPQPKFVIADTTKEIGTIITARPYLTPKVIQVPANGGNGATPAPQRNQIETTIQTTLTKLEITPSPGSMQEVVERGGNKETLLPKQSHAEATNTPRTVSTVKFEHENLINYAPEDPGKIASSPSKDGNIDRTFKANTPSGKPVLRPPTEAITVTSITAVTTLGADSSEKVTASGGNGGTPAPERNQIETTIQTMVTKPEITPNPGSMNEVVERGNKETLLSKEGHTEATNIPRTESAMKLEPEQLINYAPEAPGSVASSPSQDSGIHMAIETTPLVTQATVSPNVVKMVNNASEIQGRMVGSSPRQSGMDTPTETTPPITQATVNPNVVKMVENASEIEGKLVGSLPKQSGIDTPSEMIPIKSKKGALLSRDIHTQKTIPPMNQITVAPEVMNMVTKTLGTEGKVAGSMPKGSGTTTPTKTTKTENGTSEGANLPRTVYDIEGKIEGHMPKGSGINAPIKIVANEGKNQAIPSQDVSTDATTNAEIGRATNQQITLVTNLNKGKEATIAAAGNQLKMSIKVDIGIAANGEPIKGCEYVMATTDKGKTKMFLSKDCQAKTVPSSEIKTNATSRDNNLSDLMLLRNWNIRYVRKDDSEVEHLPIIKQETWTNARKICERAGMELGTFADNREFAYITTSMRGLCASCSETFWVKGTKNDVQRDASKCKFVHLKEFGSVEKFCGKPEETLESSFVCTRQIKPESTGINVTLRLVHPEKTTHDIYVFFAKPTTWDDAKQQCEKRGMQLATFHGPVERTLTLRMYQEKCSGCTGSYWVGGRRQEAVTPQRTKRHVHSYWHPIQRRRPSWPRVDWQQWPEWSEYERWPKLHASRRIFKQSMPLLDLFVPPSPEDPIQQEWVDICYSLTLQSEKYLQIPCSEQPGQSKDRDSELRGYICSKIKEV